jgi:RND family efflux transporter MFP subunit
MNWWKQLLLGVALIAAVIFGWARTDDTAGTRLASIGVPDGIVTILAGQESATGSADSAPPQRGAGRPSRESLVVTSEVSSAVINDRISALGDGEAVRSVTVVPFASGVLTEVFISTGGKVEAGETIAVLDSDAERIQRDRAELAVTIAEEKVARYERLVGSSAASEVQLTEFRNDLRNAQLALQDAELALQRRSIIAPIGGFVGILPVEAGDYVTTQTEAATIDDRSKILVDFWVPERFAPLIRTGLAVEATAIALPEDIFSGTVAAIASRIDRDSRTFRVRAELDNSDDRLRPGMSFRVVMQFPGQNYTAVNPLALQWSSDGPYVWKVADGKAVRTPVRILQRNSDQILVDGGIALGDEVVIEGVQSIRNGAAVRVANNAAPDELKGS